MKRTNDKDELITIPGVGKATRADFRNIGINRVSDLRGKDPEELYRRICDMQGTVVDRCVLYVCRSSVYFAETENPDPEKLKWWNWKDKQ